MLRISWRDKVTNQEVMDRVGRRVALEADITKHKLKYFGHVMRHQSLEHAVMLGMIEGQRRRGGQRATWMGGVTEAFGMTLDQLRFLVEDRHNFRNYIHMITKGRS